MKKDRRSLNRTTTIVMMMKMKLNLIAPIKKLFLLSRISKLSVLIIFVNPTIKIVMTIRVVHKILIINNNFMKTGIKIRAAIMSVAAVIFTATTRIKKIITTIIIVILVIPTPIPNKVSMRNYTLKP